MLAALPALKRTRRGPDCQLLEPAKYPGTIHHSQPLGPAAVQPGDQSAAHVAQASSRTLLSASMTSKMRIRFGWFMDRMTSTSRLRLAMVWGQPPSGQTPEGKQADQDTQQSGMSPAHSQVKPAAQQVMLPLLLLSCLLSLTSAGLGRPARFGLVAAPASGA